MKKKDQDLLLLAAVAWFLFFRKKPDGPVTRPAQVAQPSTPKPIGPVTTTAEDADGNPLEVQVQRRSTTDKPLNFADPDANAPASTTVPLQPDGS